MLWTFLQFSKTPSQFINRIFPDVLYLPSWLHNKHLLIVMAVCTNRKKNNAMKKQFNNYTYFPKDYAAIMWKWYTIMMSRGHGLSDGFMLAHLTNILGGRPRLGKIYIHCCIHFWVGIPSHLIAMKYRCSEYRCDGKKEVLEKHYLGKKNVPPRMSRTMSWDISYVLELRKPLKK